MGHISSAGEQKSVAPGQELAQHCSPLPQVVSPQVGGQKGSGQGPSPSVQNPSPALHPEQHCWPLPQSASVAQPEGQSRGGQIPLAPEQKDSPALQSGQQAAFASVQTCPLQTTGSVQASSVQVPPSGAQ
tara:strand:- start:514 stop:903 length:390 start_codon:yes stop_codon:yes gene_type:complete